MAEEKKKRRRMSLPKKKEDIEKIVEEINEAHGHDHHHHHHHHHGEIDELLTVFELLIDSMNAQIETLNSRVSRNSLEIARLYKIIGHLLAYIASDEDDEKRLHLERALSLLSGEVKVEKAAV